MNGCLIFVHWSSGKKHPPISLLVAWHMSCLSFPAITALWNFRDMVSSSSSPPMAALTYLSAPSASTHPPTPAWRPLYQRYILLVIIALIYLYLWTPNVLVRKTRARTMGLSEFQLLSRSPCNYVVRIAMNQRPTYPKGVAQKLANCVVNQS